MSYFYIITWTKTDNHEQDKKIAEMIQREKEPIMATVFGSDDEQIMFGLSTVRVSGKVFGEVSQANLSVVKAALDYANVVYIQGPRNLFLKRRNAPVMYQLVSAFTIDWKDNKPTNKRVKTSSDSDTDDSE